MSVILLLLLAAQAAAPVPLARVEAVPVKAGTTPGASVTLEVRVTPREGIHVYAPPQKQYIPVSVAMDRVAGGRVGKAQFPPSVERTFEGEKVRVYDSAFTIRIPVSLPRSGGKADLSGTVTYQACDDVMCYRPVKVPVGWEVAMK